MLTPGVRYMLLATFLFALMSVCVKLLPRIPAFEVVFFRSLISLVISYAILRLNGIHLWGNNKKLLFLRGLAGAIALTLFFITIQNMPLATAVTFQYLSSIFTAMIAISFLGERMRAVQWFFFLLSFAGIVVIKGFDARISLVYMSMGIMSAAFSGVAYNIIRKLKGSENAMVIVFYFPLVTLPLTGAAMVFNWVTPVGMEWLWLLLIGLFTQTAQYFMTRSFQSEELSRVTVLSYLGVIYAAVFGFFIFDEELTLQNVVGIAMVIAGVVMNVIYTGRK